MSPQQPPQPSQTPSTLSAMPPAGAQSHDAAGTTLAASASTREGTAAMAAIGVTVAEPAAAPGQAAAAGKRNWFGWLTTSRDNSPHDASTTPLYTGPTTAEQREAMLQITQTPLPQTQRRCCPPSVALTELQSIVDCQLNPLSLSSFSLLFYNVRRFDH